MLVVLTREVGFNDQVRGWIGREIDVVEAPLTTTIFHDVEDVRRDIAATSLVGRFRALAVTSVRTRAYIAPALAALAEGAGVYSVGVATTHMLEEEGVVVAGVAASRAQDLAALIDEGPVLHVCARDARPELSTALAAKRVDVVPVVAYETVEVPVSDDVAWLLARADVIVIGAPSSWSVARTYVSSSSWVVVPGATTAAEVKRDHARVIEAWGPELGNVLATLDGA